MTAATIERVAAVDQPQAEAHDPVATASLGHHVIITLRDHTKHAAFAALDSLAFDAIEILHGAISKRDKRGGTYAAARLEQLIALAEIMLDHEQDSGAWDSLGAVLHLQREALQQLNELREGWE